MATGDQKKGKKPIPPRDWGSTWDWLDGDDAERAAAEEALRDNLKNKSSVGDLSYLLDLPASGEGPKETTMSTTTKKPRGLKWLFNRMLIGAVLGWMIIAGVSDLFDAAHHLGRGTVNYEAPYREEIVSESEYKRHHYAQDGMMIALGLVGWGIFFAYAFRDKEPATRS
jgi:hypothetical protein